MNRTIDLLALLVIAVGIAKAAAGAAALTPEILASRNVTGIPRWVPHGVSAALVAAALVCNVRRLDFLALASLWSLAAGAFARPALLAAGWPDPRSEWLLVPVLLALAALVGSRSTSAAVRVAIAAALLATLAVALTLFCDPSGAAAPRAAPLAYTAVLLAAGLSAWRAAQLRRRST